MHNQFVPRGFTLIELMIAVGIIGILAALVIPAYQRYSIRAQIAEGVTMADAVKTAVADAYSNHGSAPASRLLAGLSNDAEDTQGKYVSAVDVINGVILVTFGNDSNGLIQNLTLTLTPYETSGHVIVWRCGYAQAPAGLDELGTANGVLSATYLLPTVPEQFMPTACRS